MKTAKWLKVEMSSDVPNTFLSLSLDRELLALTWGTLLENGPFCHLQKKMVRFRPLGTADVAVLQRHWERINCPND